MKRAIDSTAVTLVALCVIVASGCAVLDAYQDYRNRPKPELDGSIALPDGSGNEQNQLEKSDPTGDAIDLSTVKWHGADIRSWPATSELPKGVYISGNMVHFPHSKAGTWKTITDAKGVVLEGNVWAVVNYKGKWQAASWEWLKAKQTSKPWGKIEQGHFKVSDLDGYQIKKGEEVYIIAAGLSRGGKSGSKERTPAVRIRW